MDTCLFQNIDLLYTPYSVLLSLSYFAQLTNALYVLYCELALKRRASACNISTHTHTRLLETTIASTDQSYNCFALCTSRQKLR